MARGIADPMSMMLDKSARRLHRRPRKGMVEKHGRPWSTLVFPSARTARAMSKILPWGQGFHCF